LFDVTDADLLVQTLAEIVAKLAFMLEDAIGEDGELRTALNTLEWIAFVFDRLEPGQRQQLNTWLLGSLPVLIPGRGGRSRSPSALRWTW